MKDLLAAKETALSWLKPVSREILNWFQKEITVQQKADQSPVTIADQRAEEMLRKKIHQYFPDHGIIGEEFGKEAEDKEWVWTVDPIDGTRSFIQGLPLFATLLSLLHKGEPVMGIICLPALGETVWAVKGKGTYSGDRRLHVSTHSKIKDSVLATADLYCFREKKQLRFWNQLHSQAKLVRTYPDAFGHLMAIRGSVDVMVDPWAYIWDFAPCKIMVQEAGGAFMNFTGNKNSINEGSALVGNAKLVKALQKSIQATRTKKG
jgi:histidinol phosphatase-like enzyme (inositol monophosphatase family)